jgi:hypothetical protein
VICRSTLETFSLTLSNSSCSSSLLLFHFWWYVSAPISFDIIAIQQHLQVLNSSKICKTSSLVEESIMKSQLNRFKVAIGTMTVSFKICVPASLVLATWSTFAEVNGREINVERSAWCRINGRNAGNMFILLSVQRLFAKPKEQCSIRVDKNFETWHHNFTDIFQVLYLWNLQTSGTNVNAYYNVAYAFGTFIMSNLPYWK